MDGDPVVRKIVRKMYGEDPETGEGYGEMVCLYESQVIVSRETLECLLDMARDYAHEFSVGRVQRNAIEEAKGVLG